MTSERAEDLVAEGSAIPLDWDEYRQRMFLVQQVADAALREMGGYIDRNTKQVFATAPGQSQRAFRLGLMAAGVAFEVIPNDDYKRRLDAEWDGSKYDVRHVSEAIHG